METKYTLDYFIDKFSGIPANKWCTKIFKKEYGCCAFGHLGSITSVYDTSESIGLTTLLGSDRTMELFNVNDGKKQFSHFGNNPKERVVNYLKSLKQ